MGNRQGRLVAPSEDGFWQLKEASNSHNNRWACEILLTFGSMEQVEREMHQYEARKCCLQFIAPLHLQLLTDSSHCYGQIICRVLMESMRCKLTSLHLTDEDYYYALLECLRGFRQIYRCYGFVAVQKDMIGVNQHGEVRVWMNSIYSRNYKEKESELLRQHIVRHRQDLQGHMVERIHKIVSKQAINAKLRESGYAGTFTQAISHFETEVSVLQVIPSCKITLDSHKKHSKISTSSTLATQDTGLNQTAVNLSSCFPLPGLHLLLGRKAPVEHTPTKQLNQSDTYPRGQMHIHMKLDRPVKKHSLSKHSKLSAPKRTYEQPALRFRAK